jgi:hypothetical protein
MPFLSHGKHSKCGKKKMEDVLLAYSDVLLWAGQMFCWAGETSCLPSKSLDSPIKHLTSPLNIFYSFFTFPVLALRD